MERHDKFERIFKEPSKIELPMTPAKWEGDITYRPVTALKIAYGHEDDRQPWNEYVEKIDIESIDPEKMLIVTTIDGEQKLINPQYIIAARNLTMATAIIDSSNINYENGLHEFRYLCEQGVTLERIDGYSGS